MIQKLIEVFGLQFWEYVVVVLIFVNEVYLLFSNSDVMEQEFFDDCF